MVNHSDGKIDPPLHAAGKLRHLFVPDIGETEYRQQLIGTFMRCSTIQTRPGTKKSQVLYRTKVFIKGKVLWDEPEKGIDAPVTADHGLPEDVNAAAGRSKQTRHQLH